MSKMEGKLISVIVPVYNSEMYLAACLDSILDQSYKNLEIIVINDGSTDFSLKIAETYSQKDNRLTVYSYENSGLSEARNRGLEVTTGDYVTFVDADDILLPNALELLHSELKEFSADIAEGKTIRGKIQGVFKFKPQIASHVYTSEEALSDMLYQKRLLPSVCGKLFTRCLFNDLKFEKGILYEDLNIIYKVFEKCNKIVWIDYPVYFYRQSEGSILNNWKIQRLDVLKVTEKIENYITEQYPGLINAAKNRRLSANFNMFALCSKHGEREHARNCWEIIRENRRHALFNPKVRLKNKGGIILSYLGKNIFSLIARRVYS